MVTLLGPTFVASAYRAGPRHFCIDVSLQGAPTEQLAGATRPPFLHLTARSPGQVLERFRRAKVADVMRAMIQAGYHHPPTSGDKEAADHTIGVLMEFGDIVEHAASREWGWGLPFWVRSEVG